ncbi:MAG TPA: haloacid dehalogenase-like hydrolase [Candidatus Dormibacteraeota bacterium]|nr:haloacid dehalogenase-like hydrolase [Candidatus Dormibacteraeota bacterium]
MNSSNNIGAFFDLDGTLLPPPSLELRFIFYLFTRGLIGRVQFASYTAVFLTRMAGNTCAEVKANKAYFSGVSASSAQNWSARFVSRPLKFFSAGLRRLAFHFSQGHRIFLITGTPAPLAQLITRYFPAPLTIVATQLAARHGCWTGEIAGDHMCGAAKQRAIVHLAGVHSIDLARSFAYGNSLSDLRMLETVAYPAAVNPSNRLTRLARRRAWPILHWRESQAGLPEINETPKPFHSCAEFSSR